MKQSHSRRSFLNLLCSGVLLPFSGSLAADESRLFRIRTITAGARLESAGRLKKVNAAIEFLHRARGIFEAQGYEVQTTRVATEPLPRYVENWSEASGIEFIQSMDRLATDAGVVQSIGPVINDDRYDKNFAQWVAYVLTETKSISLSVTIASPPQGVHSGTVQTAAEAIAAIAHSGSGGEGNFRFAGTAFCPPGTPFFPAAYHEGEDAFSIGLESPRLLQDAFKGAADMQDAKRQLNSDLENALRPVQEMGYELARQTGRQYLGIDVSPAPGLDASIGQAIETLTGVPFGSPSTLHACTLITEVLKNLEVDTCGYSGLMLPVLEDPVLAKRAAERHYGIYDLLLYSSVCGTGLDVVPLPGDTSVAALSKLIGDVAALATKLSKPLSARLFPIPGKKAGETVHFDNPYLTDSVVMSHR